METMAISPILNSNASDQSFDNADAINDIDMGTFLKLMITELQNQDPLNPLDNKDMLAQISQIRSVGATDKLTKTLDSVLLGQNIASATNLIGADVSALSDDGESVTGIVDRVSIDKGLPKLHIENMSTISPSTSAGNLEAGKYGYRVVWSDETGQMFGMEFVDDHAIRTTGTEDIDQAVQIRNLPVTETPKYIYRTDKTGEGAFQLVGILVDGKKGAFVDTMADAERSGTRLIQPFQRTTQISRQYEVALNNVSAVRPPGT